MVAQAKATADKKGVPLRVMCQDEATVGRINEPKACWAPEGMRPTVPRQVVREYVYVFGAVSPKDGWHDSLILPCANSAAMSYFLEEVSRRHPNEHILMVMDRAGWHTSGTLKVPANIEIGYFPAHSPELNPQEQVWDELREKFFGNRIFKSLEAVVDRTVEGLLHLEANPSALASLTQRSWL